MNTNWHTERRAQSIVVIAASVGGVDALQTLMDGLPANLEAAVGIVQHVSPLHPSHLANVFSRLTPMHVKEADDGDVLCDGCVFIAHPNQHLFIQPGGVLKLSLSPPIHYTRPSAEPLFSSAAAVFGNRVVGVVLTGSDSDGSIGVQLIKNMGGHVIVQDEATSADFSMPRSAIKTGQVDRVLPLPEIAPVIVKFISEINNTPDNELSKFALKAR